MYFVEVDIIRELGLGKLRCRHWIKKIRNTICHVNQNSSNSMTLFTFCSEILLSKGDWVNYTDTTADIHA